MFKSNNWKAVILCLLIPAVLASVCEDFVSRQEQRKPQDYSNLTTEDIAFNDFSGSNIGDFSFGNQDRCLANPKMYYFVTVKRAQVQAGYLEPTSGVTERGLCLPRECAMLLHTTNDPLLLRIYRVKAYNAQLGLPLVNVKIELYDPAQNITNKPAMFYITCIFILLFVCLSFVSTAVLYRRSRQIALVDIESPQEHPNEEQNRFDWVLESFNLKRNLVNLYQTAAEQNQNQNISIFQFLRVITSYWVIYYNVVGILSKRFATFTKTPRFDKSGDLSVEYFFMMTGFLGAYTLVPKLSNDGGKIMTYFNIIKHRILRVRLLYIIALLVMWQVTPFLTTGPRWHLAEFNGMVCDNIWWRNVFMIDNLMNLHDLPENGGYCFLYGWYLSAEFQIYLVAIIAIAVYVKYRRIGYMLVIALILQSFALAIANDVKFEIDWYAYTSQTFIWSLSKHKYLPYARWYTLFIGVFWGLLYYEYSKLKKNNIFSIFETKPRITYLTMIGGVVLNLFTIFQQFGRQPENMSMGARYAWDPLRMLLITVSITMIFMPLLSDRHFYLKSFFNLRIFQILGKTSYAVYLFQVNFIELIEFTTVKTFEYSYGRVVLQTLAVLAATQAFGFFAHIFLEKPMLNIEAKLSGPEAKSLAKDFNARIEIQSKDKAHQEPQKPLPEHARPAGLDTKQSLHKEDNTSQELNALNEIQPGSKEQQGKQRLLPNNILPVDPDNGSDSDSSMEKEEKEE